MRNRLIKGDFWTDEELGALPRDARLFFIGLWNYADDWGRLEQRPQKIRVALFPYDTDITGEMVSGWIDALIEAGKLTRYEVAGKVYLFVRKFLSHQQMRRHKESTLPPPPGDEGTLQPKAAPDGEPPQIADNDADLRKSADIVGQSRPDIDKDIDIDIDTDRSSKQTGSDHGRVLPVAAVPVSDEYMDCYRFNVGKEPVGKELTRLKALQATRPEILPEELGPALSKARKAATGSACAYAEAIIKADRSKYGVPQERDNGSGTEFGPDYIDFNAELAERDRLHALERAESLTDHGDGAEFEAAANRPTVGSTA